MQQVQDTKNTVEKTKTATDTPDESGHVHIDAFVRITDPETQQVLVEIRE